MRLHTERPRLILPVNPEGIPKRVVFPLLSKFPGLGVGVAVGVPPGIGVPTGPEGVGSTGALGSSLSKLISLSDASFVARSTERRTVTTSESLGMLSIVIVFVKSSSSRNNPTDDG